MRRPRATQVDTAAEQPDETFDGVGSNGVGAHGPLKGVPSPGGLERAVPRNRSPAHRATAAGAGGGGGTPSKMQLEEAANGSAQCADAGRDSKPIAPSCCGIPMKWVSLVSLTVQTSAQALLIRWARQKGREVEGPRYLASTVVLMTELVKLFVSFLLVAWETGGLISAASAVHTNFTRDYVETLKVSVPSLLYTLQNNLMFYSLSRLSAAVQQVTYQLKILTTALLSVVMLGRVLNPTKWSALFILLVGVVLVQWPSPNRDQGLALQFQLEPLLAFGAVLVACCTSGFASVYLEMLLKQTDASIWIRNVQLGTFGSIMALLVALSQDGAAILEGGLTQGYSFRVVCVVLNNALGGLLCAAVLRYADNILRCFSTALSIILTCVLSAGVLQDYVPDLRFVVGAFLAIFATFLYSLGLPQFLLKAGGGSSSEGSPASEPLNQPSATNGHSR
mmetsp:Transcript_151156/g.485584  ORF Transcript_151156/g.485584 Transcript_151156/m.485584 type:complete len:450 (-) Transcript_151156:116-1465(-)